MLDLLKKGFAALLALFILLLSLYVAFYLFLVIVVAAAGFILYTKWKGTDWQKVWSHDRSSSWQGEAEEQADLSPEKTPKKVIDVEYEEIVVEREREQ